jgi:predicted nucleic acid-binding protein
MILQSNSAVRLPLDVSAVIVWLLKEDGMRAVLVLEPRRRLTAADAVDRLGVLDDLRIENFPEPVGGSMLALADLARPHQLTAYDALYLELALRGRVPLLTNDRQPRTGGASGGSGVGRAETVDVGRLPDGSGPRAEARSAWGGFVIAATQRIMWA